MPPIVTLAALHGALCSGDGATVSQYFAQPHTQATALRAENWFASQSRDVFFAGCGDQLSMAARLVQTCGHESQQLWFVNQRQPHTIQPFDSSTELAYAVADVLYGGDAVSLWLIATTPLTMSFILYKLIDNATMNNDALMLDMLLSTSLFCVGYSQSERAQLLGQMAWKAVGNGCSQVLNVLVAHGENVQYSVLASKWDDINGVRLLVDQGAIVVGFDHVFWTPRPSSEFEEYSTEMARLGADMRATGRSSWLRTIEDNSLSEWRSWSISAVWTWTRATLTTDGPH